MKLTQTTMTVLTKQKGVCPFGFLLAWFSLIMFCFPSLNLFPLVFLSLPLACLSCPCFFGVYPCLSGFPYVCILAFLVFPGFPPFCWCWFSPLRVARFTPLFRLALPGHSRLPARGRRLGGAFGGAEALGLRPGAHGGGAEPGASKRTAFGGFVFCFFYRFSRNEVKRFSGLFSAICGEALSLVEFLFRCFGAWWFASHWWLDGLVDR